MASSRAIANDREDGVVRLEDPMEILPVARNGIRPGGDVVEPIGEPLLSVHCQRNIGIGFTMNVLLRSAQLFVVFATSELLSELQRKAHS